MSRKFLQIQSIAFVPLVVAAAVAIPAPVVDNVDIRRGKVVFYQAKAEPVLVPLESISLDKWKGQDPEVVKRKKLPRPGLVVTDPFPEIVNIDFASDSVLFSSRRFQYQEKAEPVTVDEVIPTLVTGTVENVNILRGKTTQYQGRAEPVTVPAAAETLTLDKWKPEFPDRLNFKRTSPLTEVLHSPLPPEFQTQDRWTSSYPDRPSYRRTIPDQGLHVSPVIPPEDQTVDRWLGQVQAVNNKKVQPVQGQFAFVDVVTSIPEVVTLDKWKPSFQDLPNVKKISPESRLVQPELLQDVLVFPVDNVAVRHGRVVQYQSRFEPVQVPSEEITLDKWQIQNQELKVRPVQPIQVEFAFVELQPVEDVTSDKWQGQEQELPRHKVQPPQSEFSFVEIVSTEAFSIDKWTPSYSDQAFRRQSAPGSLIVAPEGQFSFVPEVPVELPVEELGIDLSSDTIVFSKSRLQYQTKIEPLFTEPGVPEPFNWVPIYPDTPVFNKVLPQSGISSLGYVSSGPVLPPPDAIIVCVEYLLSPITDAMYLWSEITEPLLLLSPITEDLDLEGNLCR